MSEAANNAQHYILFFFNHFRKNCGHQIIVSAKAHLVVHRAPIACEKRGAPSISGNQRISRRSMTSALYGLKLRQAAIGAKLIG